MSDAEVRARPGRNLDYPFETRPELGETIEVAPGMHWVRMRLPMQLNHINLWLLEDGDGWTVVDSGIRNEETTDAWKQLFAGPMGGRPVKRVIVTHMHPDHIGLAGWLVRKFDVELWITRTEYLMCRNLVADTGQEAPQEGVRFYRAAGFPDELLENYKTRFGGFGHGVYKLPNSYRRIREGERFAIGGRDVASRRRQRPFAGACVPVVPGGEHLHLRRSAAAADLVERVGASDRAGGEPAAGLARLLRQAEDACCRKTCWCCRRTTSRSAARRCGCRS